MQRHVEIREESWPLRGPFEITGKTWLELNAVVVELGEGEFVGWGEAAGVYYFAETVDSMIAQIRQLPHMVCGHSSSNRSSCSLEIGHGAQAFPFARVIAGTVAR
jgi:L-Ala-D/L-Glu epimerase